MNRGDEVAVSLPNDFIHEILSRLPAKSMARFRCVSKQWSSILECPYFTDLLLSRARPRLLFALQGSHDYRFYSSPQPHTPFHHKSLTADFHMTFSNYEWPHLFGLTSGLLHFSRRNKCTMPLLCNPITGRCTILPRVVKEYNYSYTLLGFDPTDKQFKVLFLGVPASHDDDDSHQTLTLGNGEMTWRTIRCGLAHHACYARLCINGVLYYLGQRADDLSGVIVCFDVRSETFKFVDAECYQDTLVNYKGKLGRISYKYDLAGGIITFSLWVLEDVEKQEWSKYVYTMRDKVQVCKLKRADASVIGITARGEIVLMDQCTSKQFYVYYFDPESNTVQSVEIEGLGDQSDTVYAFMDQVEDLNVNVAAKQLKLSHGLRTRPNPQEASYGLSALITELQHLRLYNMASKIKALI